MFFGIFVGVQGNGKSTTYGFALSADETIASFRFIFDTFKDKVGTPRLLFTDADVAMQAAAKASFPTTQHLWCQWHVVMAAAKKVPGSKAFQSRLWHIMFLEHPAAVTDALNDLKTDFPSAAPYIVSYLARTAPMWSSAYRHHQFCAAISSTQRGESINASTKAHGFKGAHDLASFPAQTRDYVNCQQKESDEYDAKERNVLESDSDVLKALRTDGLLSPFAVPLFRQEFGHVQRLAIPRLLSEVAMPLTCPLDAGAADELKNASGLCEVGNRPDQALLALTDDELVQLAASGAEAADEKLAALLTEVYSGFSCDLYLLSLGCF